ncbi:MAG: hypothetical protein H6971_03580 [Gammaproteobacteria bacterium]|nr:hypothetical protein [Gammaproteobacteria bacterium]
MAKSLVAIPLSGTVPNDPTLTPGLGMALTPQQRQQLESALRQSPSPTLVLNALQKSLQKGEPLLRILERLKKNAGQAAVLQPYALEQPSWEALNAQADSASAPRPTYRPGPRGR